MIQPNPRLCYPLDIAPCSHTYGCRCDS